MLKAISPRVKIMISMLIWGTIGLFVRGIDLDSISIAFFRAIIGSGFLLLISLVKKDRIDRKVLRQNLILIIFSGVALGFNWIALFEAMKYTTISNAILSYYFAPVFITIFSFIILKEKLNIKNVLCLLGAIIGLFIILKSDGGQNIYAINHSKGIIFGLAGALLYAVVVILNKFIKGLSGFQTTLIQLMIASLVLLPMTFSQNRVEFGAIGPETWMLIFIIGIVHTGIAYLLYFPSIKDVRSQTIAILSYLDPIFAIFTSFVFLKESMTIGQILGGVLILSTAYINERG